MRKSLSLIHLKMLLNQRKNYLYWNSALEEFLMREKKQQNCLQINNKESIYNLVSYLVRVTSLGINNMELSPVYMCTYLCMTLRWSKRQNYCRNIWWATRPNLWRNVTGTEEGLDYIKLSELKIEKTISTPLPLKVKFLLL